MDISKHSKNQKRLVCMPYEHLFVCSNDATEVKVQWRERLKRLFAPPGIDPASDVAPSVRHCVTAGNGRDRAMVGCLR